MGKSQLQWLEDLKQSLRILDEAHDDINRRRCITQRQIEKEEASIKAKIEAAKIAVAPGARILKMLGYVASYNIETQSALRELNALLEALKRADEVMRIDRHNRHTSPEIDCPICTAIAKYENVRSKL